jgi:hypothetical protein
MSLSSNELVATNGSCNECSCGLTNTHGCNLSVASGGGTLNATMTQDLSATGNPQFTNLSATGQVNTSSTNDSTSTTTGALVTAGGAGIIKNATIGGQINDTNTTNSTSTTTGAIVTAGGMGIAKNISCGGGINFGGGTLSSYSTPVSWTPYLMIDGIATGITFSLQTGNIYFVGNVAFCSFAFVLTSKGTNTGNVTIQISATQSSVVQPAINIGAWGLVGLNSGYTQLSLVPSPYSDRQAYIYQSSPSGAGYTSLTNANLTNTCGLWGNFWYYV